MPTCARFTPTSTAATRPTRGSGPAPPRSAAGATTKTSGGRAWGAAGGPPACSFPVTEEDLPKALSAVEKAAKELKAEGVSHNANLSKVSIVGLGMKTQSGGGGRMVRVGAGG